MTVEKNNKKLIIGFIFLGLLVLANLLVRLNRKNVPANVSNTITAQNDQLAENDFDIDKLIENLESELKLAATELKKLPSPFKAPNLSTPLFLTRDNLFRYDLIQTGPEPVKEPDKTDKQQVIDKIIPPRITAVFNTGQKKKLFLTNNDRMFIVNENDMKDDAQFSLVSSMDNNYFILDTEGNEYCLQFEPRQDEKLLEAIQALKGLSNSAGFKLKVSEESEMEENQ